MSEIVKLAISMTVPVPFATKTVLNLRARSSAIVDIGAQGLHQFAHTRANNLIKRQFGDPRRREGRWQRRNGGRCLCVRFHRANNYL